MANAIIKIIEKTLVALMNILTNLGLMMQKVMVDPIVRDVIPNPINMVKDAFKHKKKLMSGVMQSLFEVKRPHNNLMLVTKHAIVMALMNSGSIISVKQKTQLLKVHSWNTTMVV